MITVYDSPTTRAFRILWLLEELEQPYTCRPIDFRAGEHRSDWFLKLNPHGKVPVIDIEGTVLFESAAIVTHLCELYPEKGLMPALGSAERPHFFKWLHFAMAEMDAALWTIAKHKFAYPKELRVVGAELGPKRDLQKAIDVILEELESKPYLLGEKFSAVDLFVTTMVTWAKRIKMDELPQALVTWSLKNGERPAFQRALAHAKTEST